MKFLVILALALSFNAFAQNYDSMSVEEKFDHLKAGFSEFNESDLRGLSAETIKKFYDLSQKAGKLMFVESDLKQPEILIRSQELMLLIGNQLHETNEAFVNYETAPWQEMSWKHSNFFEKSLGVFLYAVLSATRDVSAAVNPVRWKRDSSDSLVGKDMITWPRRTPLVGRDWQRTKLTVDAFHNLTAVLTKELKNKNSQKTAELEARVQAALPLIESLQSVEPRRYKGVHQLAKASIFTVGFLVSYVFLPEFVIELTSDSPAISAAIWTSIFSYLYLGRNMNSGYKIVAIFEKFVKLIEAKGFSLEVKKPSVVRSEANRARRESTSPRVSQRSQAATVRCAKYFAP